MWHKQILANISLELTSGKINTEEKQWTHAYIKVIISTEVHCIRMAETFFKQVQKRIMNCILIALWMQMTHEIKFVYSYSKSVWVCT